MARNPREFRGDRAAHTGGHGPGARACPDFWLRLRPGRGARASKVGADAAVVGWALTWRAADEVHLLDLAVEPAFRKTGFGRRLLTHVVEHAREGGAAVVLLEVRASNRAAFALYRSVGFSETSVRRAYYSDNGEDAIVMRLELLERPQPLEEGKP